MKKSIAFALTVLILLTMASCGNKAEETIPTVPATTESPAPIETTEPTVPATTESTIPALVEPEWKPRTVRAGYGEAVYCTFSAGEQLRVIGKFMNYYVVEQEDVNLLVRRDMLRMESEDAFKVWNGYAKYGTKVFDNAYLRGDEINTLNQNTKVTVLESYGGWACIEWDGGKGYVKGDMLSKWYISGDTTGGGNKDGTDVPIGSLTSADESELPQIVLLGAYYGPEMEKDFAAGMATVLADGTEGYICLLARGDEVKVTDFNENTVTIWLGEDRYAEVPRWLLKLEGDEEYESWTGYSVWNGVIFGEYQMENEITMLSANMQVTVLDEVNGCYVVEFEDRIGYMACNQVSNTPIRSGNANGSGESDSTWTPPKM